MSESVLAEPELAVAGPEPAVAGPEPAVVVAPARKARQASSQVSARANQIVTVWAHDRSLSLGSVCGISVALALCAAAWFSGGTRTDNFRAVAALWAAYLVAMAASKLAVSPGRQHGPARMQAPRARTKAATEPTRAIRAGWLVTVCSRLSECAVYAGLAVGAAAEHWGGVWILAIAVVGMVAVRDLMTAWSSPPGSGWQSGLLGRAVGFLLTMPPGGRVLLIGVVAPVWGTRSALLALLDWAIIAIGYGIAGQVRPARTNESPAAEVSEPRRPIEPSGLVMLLRPDGNDDGDPGSPGTGPAEEAAPNATQNDIPGPAGDGADQQGGLAEPEQERAAAESLQRLVGLRDDGALARRMGTMVRGNLLPLPPAILALGAMSVLAVLGLHSLPGVLLLSPALLMLMAAPGSSHPHSGRFDWLVPAALLGCQFLYIAAIGLATGVPDPITFLLCAALLLRYCDLAFTGRPVPARLHRQPGAQAVRERGSWLGWEGRLLVIGVAAAAGIAVFAYVALTAYVGVLLCSRVLTSCLALREGDEL